MSIFGNGLLLFGLGILAQLLVTICRKFDKTVLPNLLIVTAITICTVIFIYFKAISEGIILHLEELAITSIFIFPLVGAFVFIKKILSQINELVLIVWNIGFWYLYLIHFNSINYFTLLLLIPTLFTFIVGILKVNLNHVTKIVLYVWFMIMAISISIMLQTLSTSIPNLGSKSDLLSTFFFGMTFFYTFSYFFYIIYFIPITGKGQTIEDRMKDIREHANIISSKYNEIQYNPLVVLLVVLIITEIIFINHAYTIIDPGLLLSFLFAFSAILGETFQTKPKI